MFIDKYRSFREENGLLWRVEPICKVLSKEYGTSIAQSTYYDFKSRGKSLREVNDERLSARIKEVYDENYCVYGVRKMWHQLKNEGENVARCTVERLMRRMGISGALRGKVKRTTIANPKDYMPEDLVKRNFYADAPNQLWVADFTYVSTSEGWRFVAFIIDVFARRIVGYKVAAMMTKEMVIAAFTMAVFDRIKEGNGNFNDLIHHNDKGSQYTAADFASLLKHTGIRASIGTVGDSYDNALAESINGAYKTELIKKQRPWKSTNELTLATARWVHWYNNKRINEYCDYHSPVETERMWYDENIDIRKVSKNEVS
jgi:putative transposase